MSQDVFEEREVLHHGRWIKVEFWYDQTMGPPWKEHDGHGPVRDRATKNNKRPEERLFGDGYAYDWQDAMKQARKDGWYCGIDTFMELTAKFRRVPTAGMVAEYAVQKDFDYLAGWCNDDWHWMGISVIDIATGESDHCGGYQSDEIGTPYLEERVIEMCEEIYVPSVEATLLRA